MAAASRVRTPGDLGIGQLFETVRDAVIVADAATGLIVLWNPAAEAMFGYPPEEALGMPVEALIPEALRARHRAGLAAFHGSGRGRIVDAGQVVEVPALRRDGQEIAIELTLNPIRRATVEGRFALAIVRDVTERARLRARAAEAAVLEERQRLARELHDVVAHGLSVIVLQAGAARRVAATDPDRAGAALATIEQAGRDALVEMRRLLGVMRAGAESALDPQPGLDALDALIDRLRSAGLRVELRREGLGRLPVGVDLSAYRIVQEALTNAVKHAPGARIEVALRQDGARLEVEVRDDGAAEPRPTEPPAGGHGLLGMRERVALFDGQLEAGPHGAGYRVRATLPLERAAP